MASNPDDIKRRFELWFTFAPEEPAAATEDAVTAFVDAAALRPHDAILDLGCGTGRHLFALQRLGYGALCGVDFSSSALARARERLGERNGIAFFMADFKDFLSAPPRLFDACCSFDFTLSLYPREQLPSLLALIKKALTPAGRLFFEVWDYERLCNEKPQDARNEYAVAGDVWVYEAKYRLAEKRIVFPAQFQSKTEGTVCFPDQVQYLFSVEELTEMAEEAGFSARFHKTDAPFPRMYGLFSH